MSLDIRDLKDRISRWRCLSINLAERQRDMRGSPVSVKPISDLQRKTARTAED